MAQPNPPPNNQNAKNPNKTKAPIVVEPVNTPQEERASLVETLPPAPEAQTVLPQGAFDPSSVLRVGSIPAQASALQRLNAAQGHEAAAHISRAQGNHHLSTVVSTMPRAPSKPQTSHTPTIQAQLTVGEPDDQYEQEADQVSEQVMSAAAPPPPAGEEEESEPGVQRAMLGIQPKVTVGPAHDRYEQEADRVARQVMTMPVTSIQRLEEDAEASADASGEAKAPLQTKPLAASITPLVQREAEEKAERRAESTPYDGVMRQAEEEELQAKGAAGSGFAPGADFETRLGAQRGGGSPLPTETRTYMERRFGADFGGVRVHTGGASAQLNREVQARAFTHGSDIFFNEGRYSPGTDAGKELLAHELTHTIQQGASAARTAQPSPDRDE